MTKPYEIFGSWQWQAVWVETFIFIARGHAPVWAWERCK